MYNHNKAQQSKNRVHISWDILYIINMHRAAFWFVFLYLYDQTLVESYDPFTPYSSELLQGYWYLYDSTSASEVIPMDMSINHNKIPHSLNQMRILAICIWY